MTAQTSYTIPIIQGDILQSQSRRLTLNLPSWHSFSICGAAPPEEPSGQEDPKTGGAGEGQKDPDPDGGTASQDPEKRIQSLTEAIERNKRKEAEREAELNELRETVKKYTDADKSELDRAKSDIETKTAEVQSLQDINRRLAIENAFLLNNSVQWHDSAAALKLVDLSQVEVKDGEVTNPDVLSAAIKKLADDNKWMVATEEPEPKKKNPPKSGDAPGTPPDKDKVDHNALAAKYPALRHHIPTSV